MMIFAALFVIIEKIYHLLKGGPGKWITQDFRICMKKRLVFLWNPASI